MSETLKLRLRYAAAFLLLLAVEVVIALFVHDRFVRPYLGDVLVVGVVYLLVRVFVPEKLRLLPLFVFLFAALVELMQAMDIVRLLGLEGNAVLSTAVGSTFDAADILCYAVGCALLGAYEAVRYHLERRGDSD